MTIGFPAAEPPASPPGVSGQPLVSEARSIGEQILRAARSTKDGKLAWLDPLNPRDDAGNPVRLGPHLYDGTCGVALFLACLEHATGSGEFREPTLRALAPLRRQMTHLVTVPTAAEKLQFKLGGAFGLGAYVYSFLRIGRWLGETVLLEEAAEIATLITPERIAGDGGLDVASGGAGALLALLRLDEEIPESRRDAARPLERALACGEHLLRRCVTQDGQPPAWPANGYRPWCGFAHGVAGIAYALTALAERTGREEFLAAARESLAYERLHYDPEHKNWRDLRGVGESFMTAWCHGAPGVALGRLGMIAVGDPEIESEMWRALETTRDYPLLDRDSICCGNLGRADILLQASQQLGEEDLREAARELAWRAVTRAQDRGHYGGFTPEDCRFLPMFFTGAAGIGYALLRLAEVPDLPCVLRLD
jgi:type 2 lantibiotic biosynthesis protein LanM